MKRHLNQVFCLAIVVLSKQRDGNTISTEYNERVNCNKKKKFTKTGAIEKNERLSVIHTARQSLNIKRSH